MKSDSVSVGDICDVIISASLCAGLGVLKSYIIGVIELDSQLVSHVVEFSIGKICYIWKIYKVLSILLFLA